MAAGLISEAQFSQFAEELDQIARDINDEWLIEKHGGKIYLKKKTVKKLSRPVEAISGELESGQLEICEKVTVGNKYMRPLQTVYAQIKGLQGKPFDQALYCFLSVEDEEKIEQEDDACVVDKRTSLEETLVFEYHILYSESYSVPVMYFNVHKSDGRLLPLDHVWSLVPSYYQERLKEDRWTFLTQQEHPYLCRPFYQLHPCHTERLMSNVEAIAKPSEFNYLISWLSVVGPVVLLEVPLTYGKNVVAS